MHFAFGYIADTSSSSTITGNIVKQTAENFIYLVTKDSLPKLSTIINRLNNANMLKL